MALELARGGWDVVLHYRSSASEAEELAQRIEALGRRAFTLRADLEQPEPCRELVPRAARAAGGLSALVNNASIFPASTLLDFEPEDLMRNVQLHAVAPTLLARALAARPEARHVLNILDSKITGPDQEHVAYHLSKRMLAALTRIMAVQLAPRIAVNAIAPGALLPATGADPAKFDALAATVPMRKTGNPRDVARAARYILESEFVTGQVLYVDGGRHMEGNLYG
jgi:NAD(P)-dependent dehydrogenase (short-subunit alcohol dehydrogenase family)